MAPGPKKRIRRACDQLGADPRHKKLDLRRIRTKSPQVDYRCRVGDYRIEYTPAPGGAVVWHTFHRADGYAWLEEMFR